MKKIMKKTAILLALALLAGCGKTEEVSTNEPQANEAQAEEETEVRMVFTEETESEETEAQETEITETDTEAVMPEETEEADTEKIEEETEEAETEENTKAMVATEETFDYVAIGNSITCNEESELWWGNWGMSATEEEKDYVHLVSAWLGGQSAKPVTTMTLDLKKWELAADRNAVMSDYEDYFNEHTDLITIQTGENITEYKETLGSDYPSLFRMIREKAPNAQILVLGEVLWPSEDIEAAKQAACAEVQAEFITTEEFLNGYEAFYKSALGTPVKGNDGATHTVENEVVAAHPNDDGMACIAQLVINHIQVK